MELRVGYSYFFLKDYIKAEKYFLKAYELEPDDEYARDFACDFFNRNIYSLIKNLKVEMEIQKKL